MNWSRSNYSVGSTDQGSIVFTVTNADDPSESISMQFDHETATQIAEAFLLKAAYTEYRIREAVERMTEGG